jgi:serine/threonine protein kinase
MLLSPNSVVDIQSIQNKYLFKKKLSTGVFYDCFLANNRVSNQLVAIKMLQKSKIDEGATSIHQFNQEVLQYSKLDHPSIIKLIEYGETDTGLLFMVFEYVKEFSLSKFLEKNRPLSFYCTISICIQILDGLVYAHKKGIICGDLMPDNIMVQSFKDSYRIKIQEFSIATYMFQHFQRYPEYQFLESSLSGGNSYRSPEQIGRENITCKTDIYSWGLLFLECLSKTALITNSHCPDDINQYLLSLSGSLPADLSDLPFKSLLQSALEIAPENRIEGQMLLGELQKLIRISF